MNPRPINLLSKKNLKAAWLQSRDSTPRAGRPGIDKVTAMRFAANLDHNLLMLASRIRGGTYGPAPLRAVFLPKANSDKERMICIPTVEDRLVQRTILAYLEQNNRLPVYNASSFGYIRGRGTRAAISAAIKFRENHDWCLKTDIESFFDRIPRDHLKSRVRAALGNHSLTPIISKVINCEIKPLPLQRPKIDQCGIKFGVGIRQGMPLSPMLANLILSKFDSRIEHAGMRMVRYVDDIVFFFSTKEQAKDGHEFIRKLLNSIKLEIPELTDRSKTQIIGPSDPFEFLGREIVGIGQSNEIVSRVSKTQIRKISDTLINDYSFWTRLKSHSSFQETMVDLDRSTSAYLGVYKDAHNYALFSATLRGVARTIISNIFREVFGEDSFTKISLEGRRFLGMGHVELGEPLDDLEET